MMVELILLALLILIGALWFKKLSSNPEREVKEVEGNIIVNKWGTYISIIIVSGFFVWLLITNGNFS
ncbi:MAG: hypothetical protein VXZ61_01495 [Pseudomonadota bacterium]|nr:hypothetical protein [Pseudomonadota bacterium]MED5348852.1 hypothetical protein [Pseudomonadota bacterium]